MIKPDLLSGFIINHLTIPNYYPIRIETFSDILKETAIQLEITKEELIKKLYP